jgi:dipeptidyl-peptidase III
MAADNFMTVVYKDESPAPSVTVYIDRTRLLSTARPAIATLMTKLHVWRCSADGPAATEFYDQLTEVDEFWSRIRKVVVGKMKNQAPRIFVQANTVLDYEVGIGNGTPRVRLVEYDTTVEGVIRSWCDREV